MEMKIALFFFFFLFAAAAVFAVSAEGAPSLAPGPAAGDDCTSSLVTLQDCLTYVTVGSKAKKPTSSCCQNLKKLVADSPNCLCSGFTVAKQAGINIDMTKASNLPSSCKIPDASAATCSLSPAGAPTHGPTPAAVSPSASSPASAGVSPSTVPGASSASKPAFSLYAGTLLAGLVLVVAYFSSF